MHKKLVAGVLWLLGSYSLQAQEMMSLSDAIQVALENNYGIQVAEMQIQAAENQIYGHMEKLKYGALNALVSPFKIKEAVLAFRPC